MSIAEEQAFAAACVDGWQLGLTKRELFAAMAMQGLLSNPDVNRSIDEVLDDGDLELCEGDPPHIIARMAVEAADALCKSLAAEG